MSFTVPTYAEIRDRYLQAITNLRPNSPVGPDSDNYVRASATAAVLETLYAHQVWVFRQAFPDLADDDYVVKLSNQRGLTLRAASAATGTVRFPGTAGTVIPSGQQAFTSAGTYYVTTEAATVSGAGTVDVAAQASTTGAAGNVDAGTSLTVNAPPAGLAATATIVSMTGGADIETTSELLERLLLRLSEEAQGGNATDYKRWALSVSGVSRVYVFDCRRGAGTVDVVPLPSSGLPSAELLAAVQAVIDEHRPVGMRSTSPALALAPTEKAVDVTGVLSLSSGYALSDIQDDLQTAVDGVFAELEPGGSLVRNQVISALMGVTGVTDVTLTSPAANVTSLVDEDHLELIQLGTLTLT